MNGTRGTVIFDYTRLNELWIGRSDDDGHFYGMRRIRAEHRTHPYAADWWSIGQGVGYGSSFVNFFGDLLEVWPDGPWWPDLREGLHAQVVCDAMERSADDRQWVAIDYGST